MGLFYCLNDDRSVSECSAEDWSKQFEEMSQAGTRRIGSEYIDGKHVSTVWLGANHSFYGGNKPLVFETLIFDGSKHDDNYCERYSTWDEAVKGHKKAVQWVLDGCKDE